jgi:hypothetical protein
MARMFTRLTVIDRYTRRIIVLQRSDKCVYTEYLTIFSRGQFVE